MADEKKKIRYLFVRKKSSNYFRFESDDKIDANDTKSQSKDTASSTDVMIDDNNIQYDKGNDDSTNNEIFSFIILRRRIDQKKVLKAYHYSYDKNEIKDIINSLNVNSSTNTNTNHTSELTEVNSIKIMKSIIIGNHRFSSKPPYLSVENASSYKNQFLQALVKIYRCQLNVKDDSCCCSCNSDAMFEVMKSLYDCYKKKNCDDCDCILCGHMPRAERHLGEIRKSAAALAGAKDETANVTARQKAKMVQAKADGLLTPLTGKTPEQKEKILRQLALKGLPFPDMKTESDRNLAAKVRLDLGLPPEPKTSSEKEKLAKAYGLGIVNPLDRKTPAEKEAILKNLLDAGVPLPEGKTPSEKSLIAKVKDEHAKKTTIKIPSAKLKMAREEGLLTPLEGKTPQEKERLLKGLARIGLPLPEGKSPSEKKIIQKVMADMGLPPDPKTPSEKEKMTKAFANGIITPLEGKSPAQKEALLKKMAEAGITLPEGRTPSEKALIAKTRAEKPLKIGISTPFEGKTPSQKEAALKKMVAARVPLPEGKTQSDKKLIQKMRANLGLPPEPKNSSEKDKMNKAYAVGIITPLEGKNTAQKEAALKKMVEAGIPLPDGRTPSEKALIAKVKTATSSKVTGLFTPLEGKSPVQKEAILRKMAEAGLPLPVGKTPSEKAIINKFKKAGTEKKPPSEKQLGQKERSRISKSHVAGIITPLEGKTPAQKETALKKMAEAGIPLPEGRTPSEKSLIEKVKKTNALAKVQSAKLKKAKVEGFLTPLDGKTPEQKEKIVRGLAKSGLPLPEGKSPSDQKIIQKVRREMGLPPEPRTLSEKQRMAKAQAAGIITPLEGKTPAQVENVLRKMAESGIPLPEGRTPSEKALISRIKESSSPPGKTSILTSKRHFGPPALPPLQRKILDDKTAKNMTESKGPSDECICHLLTPESQKLIPQDAKIPLPEGRAASEKALLTKTKEGAPSTAKIPSEKLRKAKAEGLLTPLEGKSPVEKEKILKGLAKAGLPFPEGKSASEKDLLNKVRASMGLPLEPKTPSEKKKMTKAYAAGIVTPLEGKTPAQKENALKKMAEVGIPLPEGRTQSEKALIAKVKAGIPIKVGIITPLDGKTPAQKEEALRKMVKARVPLPEGKTPSEKKLIQKIRDDFGLPPEPKTPSKRIKMEKAQATGIITPLEGKTLSQKEKALRRMAEADILLPEGRTPSEKALVDKVKRRATHGGIPLPEAKSPSGQKVLDKVRKDLGVPTSEYQMKIPSEKLRKARAEGILTPLQGKSPEQKEKILRGLAKAGLPLPEAKTPSEKKLIEKVRKDMGYPVEAKTESEKNRVAKGYAAGLITPLGDKSPDQKAAALKKMVAAGIPLPEGRTPSEKALISKTKAETSRAHGLFTPLDGKPPEQKNNILRGLAKAGLPLPEGKTPSEKALINKIRTEMGIPPEATTPSEKALVRKAKAEGLFTPLDGKTPAKKEKIIKGLIEAGLPIPEGKTPSEKSLIKKLRTAAGLSLEPTPSEKLGKIKAKSKAVGATAGKQKDTASKAAGIKEEIQEITKTTKCDAACGCDKKKIKFKHSYIKIRVTSPDISSFCPCPDECIPGVKGGVFVDNEGIKVTVGSVTGAPFFNQQKHNDVLYNYQLIPSDHSNSSVFSDFSNSGDSDFSNSVDSSSSSDIENLNCTLFFYDNDLYLIYDTGVLNSDECESFNDLLVTYRKYCITDANIGYKLNNVNVGTVTSK